MSQYNIITCIKNIISDHQRVIGTSQNTHNTLHSMGEPLEKYIKDVFSGALGLTEQEKILKHQEAFSYGGGTNNPPDAVLNNGDAIEVKKVESIGSVPLNSSYPKSMLYKDDSRISNYCRNIEGGNWTVKDIIYAVGCVDKNNQKSLKSLALVYGTVYCADKEYYERIFNTIKESIQNTSFSLEETNELAHINAVDPLGITYFRARGMWGIYHPFKVYDYIHQYNSENEFELVAIIPSVKFDSFENKDELVELSGRNNSLTIEDKKVKNPNNTANLINVKLIVYKR